jgi:hypothetical protein
MDIETHHGHVVQMKPFFRAAVPGKSSQTEPDWSKAPNPGDTIRDGTVVWENAGQTLFCVTCDKWIGQLSHPGKIIH